jgi:UDP-N-acetylglucosamine:LPS N-acetylglucosamine transferase
MILAHYPFLNKGMTLKASKSTILILTTHTGGGHLNLAQSLKDMLDTRYNVAIVNPQSEAVDRYYTAASRHFMKLLEWQFNLTDNRLVSFFLQQVVTLLDNGRILNVIQHIQPQLIITTHALLSYAVARANEKSRKRVPLVFQLTDLGQLHMTWFIEKHADAYLAPTNEIFAQALKQGIAKDRLHLTGRPVRRQFLNASADGKEKTLAILGFDPAVFTIFLQGGAKGSEGIDRTIESMLAMDVRLQIILAVGNNEAMASRYVGIEQVRVLPFTETIAPYMAAADVIAGKAGASFISESFMLEKPFIVTACIAGQETPNLQFIKRHNLGWVCLETSAQKELFASLTINSGLITEKERSICAFKAWNLQANQHIVPIIDQLLSS